MKRIRHFIYALVAGVSLAGLVVPSAMAINVFEGCDANPNAEVCQAQGTDDATNLIEIVVNTMIFLLGIISVIMIVVGGIRYTTSGGDASGVKSARDTIIYSVAGLVVAILSYAIVNFVLGRF